MGISRSTTVVIAYLIATTKMTPREALAAVGAKRAIVRPNRGFMSQLQEYYSQSSNSLQAQLSPDDSVPPPEDEDGKRRRNVMASWRGGGKWGPKKLSENNALAVATSLLSRIPSSLGGQESYKSKHTS
jgi:Dual specificity phosphatase, catalytic domain